MGGDSLIWVSWRAQLRENAATTFVPLALDVRFEFFHVGVGEMEIVANQRAYGLSWTPVSAIEAGLRGCSTAELLSETVLPYPMFSIGVVS